VDYTKYAVEISGRLIKTCTFKNHALFAVIKYLCEDRVPRITPEEIQRASGLTNDQKQLFYSVDGDVSSTEFVAELTQRKSNWWCDNNELIRTGRQTFAFNREWGHNFPIVRENLMEHFPEVNLVPCP
jgi:hypothetical protein